MTPKPRIDGTIADGELSDTELEQLAGGKGDVDAECTVYDGGSGVNSVMQINGTGQSQVPNGGQ